MAADELCLLDKFAKQNYRMFRQCEARLCTLLRSAIARALNASEQKLRSRRETLKKSINFVYL